MSEPRQWRPYEALRHYHRGFWVVLVLQGLVPLPAWGPAALQPLLCNLNTLASVFGLVFSLLRFVAVNDSYGMFNVAENTISVGALLLFASNFYAVRVLRVLDVAIDNSLRVHGETHGPSVGDERNETERNISNKLSFAFRVWVVIVGVLCIRIPLVGIVTWSTSFFPETVAEGNSTMNEALPGGLYFALATFSTFYNIGLPTLTWCFVHVLWGLYGLQLTTLINVFNEDLPPLLAQHPAAQQSGLRQLSGASQSHSNLDSPASQRRALRRRWVQRAPLLREVGEKEQIARTLYVRLGFVYAFTVLAFMFFPVLDARFNDKVVQPSSIPAVVAILLSYTEIALSMFRLFRRRRLFLFKLRFVLEAREVTAPPNKAADTTPSTAGGSDGSLLRRPPAVHRESTAPPMYVREDTHAMFGGILVSEARAARRGSIVVDTAVVAEQPATVQADVELTSIQEKPGNPIPTTDDDLAAVTSTVSAEVAHFSSSSSSTPHVFGSATASSERAGAMSLSTLSATEVKLLLGYVFEDGELHKASVPYALRVLLYSSGLALTWLPASLAAGVFFMLVYTPRCAQFTHRLWRDFVLEKFECPQWRERFGMAGELIIVLAINTWPYVLFRRLVGSRTIGPNGLPWHRWHTLLIFSAPLLIVVLWLAGYSRRDGSLDRALAANVSNVNQAVSATLFYWPAKQLLGQAAARAYGYSIALAFSSVYLLKSVVTPAYLSTTASSRVVFTIVLQAALTFVLGTALLRCVQAFVQSGRCAEPFTYYIYLLMGLHLFKRIFVFSLDDFVSQAATTFLYACMEIIGRGSRLLRKTGLVYLHVRDWNQAISVIERERVAPWRLQQIFFDQAVEFFSVMFSYFVIIATRLNTGTAVSLGNLTVVLLMQVLSELFSDYIALYFERAYLEVPDIIGWIQERAVSLVKGLNYIVVMVALIGFGTLSVLVQDA